MNIQKKYINANVCNFKQKFHKNDNVRKNNTTTAKKENFNNEQITNTYVK